MKLDIKKSSYKKVSVLLQHCKKLSLLGYKEDNGVGSVTFLNKTHDLFRGVKVENPDRFKLAVTTGQLPPQSMTAPSVSGNAMSNSNSSGGGSNSNTTTQISVVELHKFPKTIREAFKNSSIVLRGEFGEYLKGSEVSIIIQL